eukprot:403359363
MQEQQQKRQQENFKEKTPNIEHLIIPQLSQFKSNKVQPIGDSNQGSRQLSPAIEVQSLGLQRGNTFVQEDQNYLMPQRKNSSRNNVNNQTSQSNNLSSRQLQKQNNSHNDTFADKNQSNREQDNIDSNSKSTAGFSFFKRMLSGNFSKRKRESDSLAVPNQNTILKRAKTDMRGRENSKNNSTRLSQKSHSRKVKNSVVNDTDSFQSFETLKLKALQRKPSFGRKETVKEIQKSKELFNILKLGAFQSVDKKQQQNSSENQNIAKMHILDLNRISKMNSFKKGTQPKKSQRKESKQRLDEFKEGITAQIANKLEESQRSHSNSIRDQLGDLHLSKFESVKEYSRQNSKNSTQLIPELQNWQLKKIQKQSSFVPKNRRKNLEESPFDSRQNSLTNQDSNQKEKEKILQNNLALQGIENNLLLVPQSRNKGLKSGIKPTKLLRSITSHMKKKVINDSASKKEMTIEELKAQILEEKHVYMQQRSVLRIQRKLTKQKDTQSQIIPISKISCCCKKFEDLNDSVISSDGCEENSRLFKQMDTKEKQDHLQQLWKKSHIKARAGASVLRLFNDLARKIYLFGVSNGFNQIERDEIIPIYILMPSHRFRSVWNIMTIVLLVYTALFMPFKVAFVDQDTVLSTIIDWVVDSLFFFDILITFFTGYEETDGSFQYKLKSIAKNYIQTSFIIDLIACFPFQVFAGEMPSGGSYQKLLRLLRIPRLFKLLRIIKVLKQIKFLRENKTFGKIMKKLSMNTAIVRMVQGMVASVIITHLFACFWFLSAKFDDFEPDTWVVRANLLDEDYLIQYLYSLYWSTQTVITVGYGDIPSVTPIEMIISLFWMIFGVGFYSFIIGNYSSIIQSNIQIQASIQLRIKSLAELAKKAAIPVELAKKIKKFIENNFEAIYNQDDEAQLIKMLPPSLRDEVLSNTFGEVIEKINFFKEMKDPDFLWKILPLLRPIKLEKSDVLYWRGDHAEDIYFIIKGSIKLYTDKGYPFIKYTEGDFFGDSDTLLNLARDGKAIALTHLKLMVLKIDQMFEKSFENSEKNFMEMIFNARKRRNAHLRLIKTQNKKYKKKKKYQILQKRTWNPATVFDLTSGDENAPKLTGSDAQPNNSQETSTGGLFSSIKNKIKTLMSSKSPRGLKSNFLSFNLKKTDGTKNTDFSPLHTKSQNTETDGNKISSSSALQFSRHETQPLLSFGQQNNNKNNQNQNIISQGFQSLSFNRENSSNSRQDNQSEDQKQGVGGLSPANYLHQRANSHQINLKDFKINKQLSIIEENETNVQNTPMKPNLQYPKQQNNQQIIPMPLKQKMQTPKNQYRIRANSKSKENNNNDDNSSYKLLQSQKSISIQGQKISDIPLFQKNFTKKHTVLDKVLQAAFQTDDMENLYKKYPFLKDMNNDEVQKVDSFLTSVDDLQSGSDIDSRSEESSKRGSVKVKPTSTIYLNEIVQIDYTTEKEKLQKSRRNSSNLKLSGLQTARNKKKKSTLFLADEKPNIKTNENDENQQLSSNIEHDEGSIYLEDQQIGTQGGLLNLKTLQSPAKKSLQNSPDQMNKYNKTITKINEQIQSIEKQEQNSKKQSEININQSILQSPLPKKTHSNNKFDEFQIPKIIIQERLNKSKDDLSLQEQFIQVKTPQNQMDFMLLPMGIDDPNYQKNKNTLQLPPVNITLQSPKIPLTGNNGNKYMQKQESLSIPIKESPINQQRRIPRSLDPSPYAGNRPTQKNPLQKKRTESMRVVVQRPSFIVLRQNTPQVDFQNIGLRNQFISPISLQRICNIDAQNQEQSQSSQDKYISMKGDPTSKLNQQLSFKVNTPIASRGRTLSQTTGKKSLQEAVSQVYEQKNSLRLLNTTQNYLQNQVTDQYQKSQFFLTNKNNDMKGGKTTTVNQNSNFPPFQSKGTFTDAVNRINKRQQKQEEQNDQNFQEEDLHQQQIGDHEKYLDEQLLLNQSEHADQTFKNLDKADMDISIKNIRSAIVDEIKKKFSKNLNHEYMKLHSGIQSLNSKQFSNKSVNQYILMNPMENAQNKTLSDKINVGRDKDVPIQNSQNLTYNQAQKLYQDMWNDQVINEQQIEFYGDPAVVGLVQFNADMGHIAMNVFETFTIFDLICKSNQQVNESIQLISAQNEITLQRQDNMDMKMDEMELKFQLIQQLKSFKSQHQNKIPVQNIQQYKKQPLVLKY